ncbi:ABC transporter substrate-binding protein [Microbacterium kribbense]|uniref:ABC transporter substrate-binding protein n=1 Tax=Microbacterium kribbense TaxID=433645 RepID=A0ABP7GDW2_9MICO
MRRTAIFAGAGISALALMLAACSGTGAGDGNAKAGTLVGTGTGSSCTISGEVPVAAAFSLTGAAAQYGAGQKNAVELAVENLNKAGGVKYKLTVEDDQTDPKQGIQLFEQFVQDGSSVIIGPTLSNTAMQTDPVAQEGKTPVLGVSNTAEGITALGDYIFRDSLTEGAVIPQTIKAAVAAHTLKNVVLMYSNDDAFTTSGYQAMKAALDADGVKILDTVKFSKTDTDFHALLDQVKNAKPDAIVVSALLDAAVPLVTQARELGITVPIVGGNGFNSPALIKGAGAAAEGVIVGAAWNSASENPQNQQFLKDYQAKFNAAPDQFAAQAYAGMQVIDDAVRIGCSGEREAIKTNLSKVKDLPTVLGDMSIDSNRDAVQTALVQVIKDGKFTILK